ncbi:MAG: adenosine kinase, partial [Acidimicrobiales bacterium]
MGVGNAIVDVIAEVSHAFIDDHELAKNSMTLIDLDRANELEVAMPSGITASGGSAANTMVGVAGFGGIAAYLGLVAADDLGEAFRSDL